MKEQFKKYIASIGFLRTPLTLARRIWNSRRHIGSIVDDLKATSLEASGLQNIKKISNGKNVLIFAVDDDGIYALKLFAFLATGLMLEGWNPIVVFRNRSCVIGKKYFKAFNINDFVYLDDIKLGASEIEQCKRESAKLMQGPLDLQAIKHWRFEEAWIGPQMISTLSRLRFEGMPDFQDPAVKALLANTLPNTLAHVIRAHKLLSKVSAHLALVIEANYSVFGPLVDVTIANGIDVIQLIQPWKDDALILKRLTRYTRRDHPGSVDKVTLDKVTQGIWTEHHERQLWQIFSDRYSGKWFLQARNQQNTNAFNRTELVRKLELNPDKKIATVFSHVLWDANLFYGEDLFKDYGDWFVQTVKAACANPNVNWLIKIHPANVWKRSYEKVQTEYAEIALIRREIGQLPSHVKILAADTDISTYSLFEITDYGVTVRGTSGMEIGCFGKPCVTAGTGRYSHLGFTIDSRTSEEYLHRLAHLHELSPMTSEEVKRAKWHAFTSFVLRPWTMKSARSEFAYKKQGSHPLDHNLKLTVRSEKEIAMNNDLKDWADWAAGHEVDYINGFILKPVEQVEVFQKRSNG